MFITQGQTHQVHLVPDSNHTGRDMLRRIADDRDQDQANEVLANLSSGHDVVNTVDEVVRAERNDQCYADEHCGCGPSAHSGPLHLLLLFLPVLRCLARVRGRLGVEKVLVRPQLEKQVENIQQEQDDSCAPG